MMVVVIIPNVKVKPSNVQLNHVQLMATGANGLTSPLALNRVVLVNNNAHEDVTTPHLRTEVSTVSYRTEVDNDARMKSRLCHAIKDLVQSMATGENGQRMLLALPPVEEGVEIEQDFVTILQRSMVVWIV